MTTNKDDDIVVHLSPAWYDRANFLVFASIPRSETLPKHWEQIWALQKSSGLFEICCIPFFIYDFALGDIVETTAKAGKQYVIQKIVKRSGHKTFRVSFIDSSYGDAKEDVLKFVKDEMDCLVEWHSVNLLAIDAPTQQITDQITDFLREKSEHEQIIFEFGWVDNE
jgi:hypothetical protein